MPLTKTTVFISSNFEEFEALRRYLRKRINENRVFPLQAVDLNENRASPLPPVSKSMDAAKQSDIVILLIGERYGGIPSGEQLSYAHLEYRAAIDISAKAIVLPYQIVSNQPGSKYVSDRQLSNWIKEVEQNQTIARYDSRKTDFPTIASLICEDVQKAIYDSLTENEQTEQDYKLYKEQYPDSDFDELRMSELDFLEQRSGVDLNSIKEGETFRDEVDAISKPAKAAAVEQRQEAMKALELRERHIAMKHLRRALEHRPLDLETNYWLARILISTRRRNECSEARELSLTSVKLAKSQNRPVRAAVGYILAAQAAARAGDDEDGLSYARLATEAAPWFATPYIELSCQLARNRKIREAFAAIESAFYRYPFSVLKLNREPIFKHFPKEFREFKKGLREKVRIRVQALLEHESYLRASIAHDNSPSQGIHNLERRLSRETVTELVLLGRQSVRQQLDLFQQGSQKLSLQDRELQETMARHKTEQEKPKPKIRFVWLIVLFLAGIIFNVAFEQFRVPWPLLFAGICVDCSILYTMRRRAKKSLERSKSLLEMKEKEMKQAINGFSKQIKTFEKFALEDRIFSPPSGYHAAKLHSLIRIDMTAVPEINDLHLDRRALPPNLNRRAAEQTGHELRFQLFRIIGIVGGVKLAARWACYCEYEKNDSRFNSS